MATTADELEQYQQIDRERLVTEAEMAREKGLRRWNRLMPADEVTNNNATTVRGRRVCSAGAPGSGTFLC